MKMRYILFLTATLYVASQIALAQARYEKEPANKITFKIKNAGMDVTGSIDAVELKITFDENNLGQSSVFAVADPKTINTGIRIRDQHLRRSDYFDVVHYPSIKLKSKSFKKSGKKFEGRFDLTIKDKTREVVIPFVRKRKEIADTFEGSFVINRMDFQLGEDSAILDEKVEISSEISQ
jgi:polyisoprenoid-binding protein YceI